MRIAPSERETLASQQIQAVEMSSMNKAVSKFSASAVQGTCSIHHTIEDAGFLPFRAVCVAVTNMVPIITAFSFGRKFFAVLAFLHVFSLLRWIGNSTRH